MENVHLFGVVGLVLLALVSSTFLFVGVRWANQTLRSILEIQVKATQTQVAVWDSIIRLHEETIQSIEQQRVVLDHFVQLAQNVTHLVHKVENRLEWDKTRGVVPKGAGALDKELLEHIVPLSDDQLETILKLGHIPPGVIPESEEWPGPEAIIKAVAEDERRRDESEDNCDY